MTSVSDFVRTHFFPLWQQGYFLSIFGGEKEALILDCLMYFTDFDEETGAHTLLRLDPSDPTYHDGCCSVCNRAEDEKAEWKNGSVICPLCSKWTKPWTLTEKSYRGTFKINPGEPATLLPLKEGVTYPEKTFQISGEAMVSAVCEALSQAHLYDI